MSNTIQKVARFFFSLKFDFKLNQVVLPEKFASQTVTDYSTVSSQIRNVGTGVTNAAYGKRFVLFPFEFFVAILLNKKPDKVSSAELTKISKENKLLELNHDFVQFQKEFENWRNRFFLAFKEQDETNNEALSALREEIFHNAHLSNTTTWNTSQTLTVLFRLTTAYLAFYRYKLGDNIIKKDKHISNTKFLLNIYFIRQTIAKFTTPFVEAYFHYKDENLLEIRTIYGFPTYKICLGFKDIDSKLKEQYPKKKDEILELISKIVFDYPFAFQISEQTGFNYLEFYEFYKTNPEKRFIEIGKLVSSVSHQTSDELIGKINELFLTPSNFEKNFLQSILHYGTTDLIPSSLIYFIAKQVSFTKYNLVVLQMLKDIIKGGEAFNTSYEQLPAVRSYGMNDTFFNIDPAMKLFNGKAFFIAQNSLEPTLAGENGYTDILHSKRCVSLLIQSVFIKALYWNFEQSGSLEYFIRDYSLSFRTRPYLKTHKEIIEKEILPIFYQKSEELIFEHNLINTDSRVLFTDDVSKSFELAINELVGFTSNLQLEVQNKFLTFCDLNYVHGF